MPGERRPRHGGLTGENGHRGFKYLPAIRAGVNRQQLLALVLAGLMVASSVAAVASIF